MKIKPDQLDRLASQLVATYRKKDLIVGKATDAELKAKIVEAIKKHDSKRAKEMVSGHLRASQAAWARENRSDNPPEPATQNAVTSAATPAGKRRAK